MGVPGNVGIEFRACNSQPSDVHAHMGEFAFRNKPPNGVAAHIQKIRRFLYRQQHARQVFFALTMVQLFSGHRVSGAHSKEFFYSSNEPSSIPRPASDFA